MPATILQIPTVKTITKFTDLAEGYDPLASVGSRSFQAALSAMSSGMLGMLNVIAFGADNTGVNDSTSAVQTAITTAGTGSNPPVVYFPAGTYKITGEITLHSNLYLCGAGPLSILNITSTDRGLFAGGAGTSNISIRDLKFTGQTLRMIAMSGPGGGILLDNLDISGNTVTPGAQQNAAIQLTNMTGVRVMNCYLHGNGPPQGNDGSEIYIDGGAGAMSDIMVRANRIVGQSTAFAVFLANVSTNCTISDNDIDQGNTINNNTSSGYGITFYGQGSAENQRCNRATVRGNNVRNCGGTGIYLTSVNDFVVSNNSVYDVCKKVVDGAINSGGIALGDANFGTVHGNIIQGVGGQTVQCPIVTVCYSVAITGNQIRAPVLNGNPSIYLKGSAGTNKGCLVVGNVYPTGNGIADQPGVNLIANNQAY
jgi:parallel beta-helix repeat protein